jgi:molybdopterin-guanine dinucleotide biosynthesis protein A
MGCPKHLLKAGACSWLERTISVVAPLAEEVILVGGGPVSESCRAMMRIDDAPETRGPLAGVLAALRHDRGCAWLVLACDLPCVRADALHWLIAQRRTGGSGVIPILSDGRPQPLLAIYESTAVEDVEVVIREGRIAPRELAGRRGFLTPRPPVEMESSWTNVNTPEELAAFQASVEGG